MSEKAMVFLLAMLRCLILKGIAPKILLNPICAKSHVGLTTSTSSSHDVKFRIGV